MSGARQGWLLVVALAGLAISGVLGPAATAGEGLAQDLGRQWTIVPMPSGWPKGGVAGDRVRVAVAGGPGFVAATGNESSLGSELFASRDGVEWAPVAWAGADLTASIFGLAAGEPGIVAVGAVGPDEARKGAAWFSPDGLAWTRVEGLSPEPPRDVVGPPGQAQALVASVAGGPGGFVALSATVFDCDCGPGDLALWGSADGVDWHRIDVTFPDEAPTSVVGGPHGYLVHGLSGVGLFSRDGTSWGTVTLPRLNRVVPTTRGFLGLGPHDQDAEAWFGPQSIWASEDGATWREVYVPTRRIEEAALVAVGPGALVLGTTTDGAPELALRSPDGEQWEEPGDPAHATLDCCSAPVAATDGRRVVLFGEEPAVAWSSPALADPLLPQAVAAAAPRDAAGTVRGSWSEGAPSGKTIPFTSLAATLPDGRVLLVADKAAKSALYDPVSDSWTPIAARPGEGDVAAAAVGRDGRLYAFVAPRHSYGYDLGVLAYDPGSDAWTRLPQAPVCCRTAAAVGVDGRIYLFGGASSYGAVDADREVVRFDPSTGGYTNGAPFPGSAYVATPAAVQEDGRMQVVDRFRVWTYDPDADAWAPGPRLPSGTLSGPVSGGVQDGGQPVALPDGRLLLLGRSCLAGTLTTQPVIIDPVSGAWWTGPATPEPIAFALLARDGLGRVGILAGERLVTDGCDEVESRPLKAPLFLTLDPG